MFRWCSQCSVGVLNVPLVFSMFCWCSQCSVGVLNVPLVFSMFCWCSQCSVGVLNVPLVFSNVFQRCLRGIFTKLFTKYDYFSGNSSIIIRVNSLQPTYIVYSYDGASSNKYTFKDFEKNILTDCKVFPVRVYTDVTFILHK